MKKIEPSTQIAPGFTVTDWNALRQMLIKDFDKDGLPESWIRAQQVFEARILIDPEHAGVQIAHITCSTISEQKIKVSSLRPDKTKGWNLVHD